MLDSLLMMEIIAEQKRSDIEGRIKRGHLSEIAAASSTPSHGVRGAVAAAIVRFGIMLDANAGRRAAAPQL